MSDEAARLASEIEASLPAVTSFLPLPNVADGLCARLVALHVNAASGERDDIRSAGSLDQYRVLLAFSERMAVLAVRTCSANLLFDALVAHAIEDFRWDPRENLLRLALIHHSAKKLGVDAAALVARAAELASPSGADYLRRSPLTLDACGYSEAGEGEHFEYLRSW